MRRKVCTAEVERSNQIRGLADLVKIWMLGPNTGDECNNFWLAKAFCPFIKYKIGLPIFGLFLDYGGKSLTSLNVFLSS